MPLKNRDSGLADQSSQSSVPRLQDHLRKVAFSDHGAVDASVIQNSSSADQLTPG